MSSVTWSIEQLLDETPTEEIVRKATYVAVTTWNRPKLKACCPLHSERTPSFEVTGLDRAGRYHRFQCYGCGARGDAIDLLALLEKTTRKEMLEAMPQRLGLKLPALSKQPSDDEF